MPRTNTGTRFERIKKLAQDTDPILWAFIYSRSGELILAVPNDQLHDAGIDEPGAMVALYWGATADDCIEVAATLPLASLLLWPRG